MTTIVKSIGLMSGTSLDGLDICYVEFSGPDPKWEYKILNTKTIPYSPDWENRLRTSIHLNDKELKKLHYDFGQYLGDCVNDFVRSENITDVHFIASHGHTVFHEPDKGVTVQVGDGKILAKVTGIQVINDFRITDVRLGGQGAPLVPVGDEKLFGSFDACLNLGGIANISFEFNGNRVAYDICPANLPLNKWMKENFQKSYDTEGLTAKSGKIIDELLSKLNQLEFYSKPYPKSLGIEWLISEFYPVLMAYADRQPKDVLRTILEHETDQIAEVFTKGGLQSCLVTGGGAYNAYFIQRLSEKTSCQLIVPDHMVVEFKEALVFAFLGLLSLRREVNTYKSVTGAKRDSVGGILHKPL